MRELVEVEEVGFWVQAADREDGGWTLYCWPFALPIRAREAVGPIGGMEVSVAADGTVELLRGLEVTGLSDEDQYRPLVMLVPVLMAISFAHCRNVSQEVTAPSARLSAHHQRRYGHPLSRYRVLRIDPMRETLCREGRSEEVGLRRALHICRGHFKTYDERPLFGRIRGTYFWPEHVRGHADRGIVRKDYVVLTPQSDGTLDAVRGPHPAARYASRDHVDRIEAFSIEHAAQLVQARWPDAHVMVAHRSNPGYDIEVTRDDRVVRYVEVKGTSAEAPGFFVSETERLFSVDHAGLYSLLVLGGINLAAGTFSPYWHDGAIDDRFSLRPTQWRGTLPIQ